MKRMDHKEKLKLARKMMTKQEIKNRVPPFQSKAWESRVQARENKVIKRIAKSKKL